MANSGQKDEAFNASGITQRSPTRIGGDCPWCEDPNNSRMITCDCCKKLYHMSCVDVIETPKNKRWYCSPCRKAAKEKAKEKAAREQAKEQKDNSAKSQKLGDGSITSNSKDRPLHDGQVIVPITEAIPPASQLQNIGNGRSIPTGENVGAVVTSNIHASSSGSGTKNTAALPSTSVTTTTTALPSVITTAIYDEQSELNTKIYPTLVRNECQKSSRKTSISSMSTRAKIELKNLEAEQLLWERQQRERRIMEEKRRVEEEANLKEKHYREQMYLKKKLELEDRSVRGSNSSGDSMIESLDRTNQWVEKLPISLERGEKPKVQFKDNLNYIDGPPNASQQPTPYELNQRAPSHSGDISSRLRQEESFHRSIKDGAHKLNVLRSSTPTPWLAARNMTDFVESSRRDHSVGNETFLDTHQITSRQALPRELPIFTGSPQEWPLFISCFVNTTDRCGFSNEENLIRLQKALKGDALNAVRGQLMMPETVPEVLNTLRMLYGRPEVILASLIREIRREPVLKQEALDQLIRYALKVQNMCATIVASRLTEHSGNPMLIQELVEKLPASMKLEWARHKRRIPKADLVTFNAWLFDIAEAASEVTTGIVDTTSTTHQMQGQVKTNRTHASKTAQHYAHAESPVTDVKESIPTDKKEGKCVMCAGSHGLHECQKFKDLGNKRERWSVIIKHRLCGNCFGKHYFKTCGARKQCGIDGCKQTHHQLLHGTSEAATTLLTPLPVTTIENINTHNEIEGQTLFRVIPVVLHGPKSAQINTFAFIDEGSSISLMDDTLAQQLHLEGTVEPLCLKWTGDTTRVETGSRRVSLTISGAQKNNTFQISNVRTVSDLNLPVQSLDVEQLKQSFQHLRNIPVQSYVDAMPRILIGLAHWSLGLPLESSEGGLDEPIATKSRLGWSISGRIGHAKEARVEHYHMCECRKDDDLHQQVKEFFSLENFGVRGSGKILESEEDRRSRKILSSTTKRIGERFETGLLWRDDNINLPDSLPMALRRLFCLEKKMSKEPTLRENLKAQIEQYVEKGYARKLPREEANTTTPRTWYLPLFAVTNPNKPGKVRMVWDAAASVNGTSLNTNLLKGPDLLIPLPEVLFRFRQRNIALCGDIREMFHQILVSGRDRESQRFLWRSNENDPIETYEMCVMTFGASCSPSAAQYVKNLNAEEFKEQYPRAQEEITKNHYVDDWLTSFSSIQEATETAKEVRLVHKKAGFEIRNWASNSKSVLVGLGQPVPDNNKNINMSHEQADAKVLGMWWATEDDSLYFPINLLRVDPDLINGTRKPTKREVLRVLMLIFDPLGLIAFFLVFVKILLQEIWRSSIGWDEQICDEQMVKWDKWTNTLKLLNEVKIPRCYTMLLSVEPQPVTDLHVFVDASENAYAAAAYFLVHGSDGTLDCMLVSAKTKIAPQKLISIPRLELQAAVLGTRLAASIAKSHSIKIHSRTFWSDSTTVLSWIRSDARRYVQFVGFRTDEIQSNSKVTEWRYVPTASNVADDATKWTGIPLISSDSRWFKGPEFLKKPPGEWPVERVRFSQTEDPELRKTHCTTQLVSFPNACPDPNRISLWRILVRAQALVLRVLDGVRHMRKGSIVAEEMSNAEDEIIRQVQRETYCNELTILAASPPKQLDKSSTIYTMSPYLDEKRILRMKGRIDAAQGISELSKNPIILPHNHRSTFLIVASYHRRYHHHNHEAVVNEVRQRFYITKLRPLLKKVRFNCQKCKNERAKPVNPMMADLPDARLAMFTRPFTFVGLDYFGPMEVLVGRRIEKRWGALFTCLTVRAVHIELVNNLSSDSCILVIRNFIARRGLPQEIWTDNGTNFRGADVELRRELEKLDNVSIINHFDRITWKFIPPATPHMGGCWERLVRSIKDSLYVSLPTRRPTEELLRSCLLEAESLVNSRPLTYIPIEPGAMEALTPNHFLLGSSSGIKPLAEFTDDVFIQRKNWKIAQRASDGFWKRFILEYLPTITRRTKWFNAVKPIEIGDVGVLWENNRRGSWQLGRVIDTIRGKNSQVRQVIIQTETGRYTRPASKFAILDVKEEDNAIQETVGESPSRSTHGGENVA